MEKDTRLRTKAFINEFFNKFPEATVADCVLALKHVKLDPGAGLVKAIRSKHVQARGYDKAEEAKIAAASESQIAAAINDGSLELKFFGDGLPEGFDREELRKDLAKKVTAIRRIIIHSGPTATIRDVLQKCFKLGVPTRKEEVRTLMDQTWRGIQSMSRKDPTVKSLSDAEFLVRRDRELASLGTPDALLKEDEAKKAKLAELEQERQRKERAQAEREQKQEERAKEREAQWAAEREELKRQAETAALVAAGFKEEKEATVESAEEVKIKAKTGDLPEAVAQHFNAKLNGESSPSQELAPELLTGRLDNMEGRAIRMRWTEDFFLQKPQMTGADAQLALKALFGIGLDTYVINDILKTARELFKLPYWGRKRRPDETSEAPEVVEVPRKATPLAPETRILVTWPDCQRPSEGTVGTLTEVVHLGVRLEVVSVWRPMKVNHTTVTTVTVLAEIEES